jgi:hypothetical protein
LVRAPTLASSSTRAVSWMKYSLMIEIRSVGLEEHLIQTG